MKNKKFLFGIILGLSIFGIAAMEYGNVEVWGQLKVDEIQHLNNASGVYIESVQMLNNTVQAAAFYKDGVEITPEASFIDQSICQGRLTLTSDTPVTNSNVTAATTLYYTPYLGDKIALYNGTSWSILTFTEASLSLSGLSASTIYDIYGYNDNGSLALSALAWTDDSTRATELVMQNKIYVKSDDSTCRYLGTIRTTTTAGECEDSKTNRFVWNMYNRISRFGETSNSNASWTYTTNAWREYNGGSGQTRCCFVVGQIGDKYVISSGQAAVTSSSNVQSQVGVSLNTTAACIIYYQYAANSSLVFAFLANSQNVISALGYNYVTELEIGDGAHSMTVYGAGGFKAIISLPM